MFCLISHWRPFLIHWRMNLRKWRNHTTPTARTTMSRSCSKHLWNISCHLQDGVLSHPPNLKIWGSLTGVTRFRYQGASKVVIEEFCHQLTGSQLNLVVMAQLSACLLYSQGLHSIVIQRQCIHHFLIFSHGITIC